MFIVNNYALAIVCNGIASGKVENAERDPAQNRKGIIIAAGN